MKPQPKPKPKRMARRIVTFEDPRDQAIWLRGQIGGSTEQLMRLSGETKGQVYYRLRVLKETLGLGVAIRTRWRNGQHPLFRRILHDYHEVMMADLRRNVIPKLAHPTAETVNIET